MKNVFDVNVNANEYDGAVFYGRKVSPELEKQIADLQTEAYGLLKKLSPYFIVEIGLVVVSAIIAMNLIGDGRLSGLLGFSAKSCVAIGLIIVAVTIHFSNRNRKNAVIGALEKGLVPAEENLQQKAREELQIPETHFEMEVLSDPYELVKGWKYLQHKEYSDNLTVDVYQREDAMCFFDGTQEFEILLDEIVSIDIVRKKKIIEEWLKDNEYDEEPYKEFGVLPRRTKNPGYIVHSYYQICIDHQGGQYEIIVPNYEEEVMRKIIEMVKRHKL